METGGLEDGNHRCEIIEAKVVNPGVFKSNYSSYFIKTVPEGWVAERKYENFLTLRSTLCKMYPGYIVPPITNKVEKKLEKEDIDKKKHYLQLFLNDLMANPILRRANIFHLFISIPSEKEYEAKSKAYIKSKPPKYVQDYHTFEGIARVSFDAPLNKYCSALASRNTKLKELYREYF